MDDLIAWLRAQMDRQEAALIAYHDHRAGDTPCDNLDDYDTCTVHLKTARATEYRDVTFGLAEVEAKRRILAWLADVELSDGTGWSFDGDGLLRLLAQPYAGRDGWREEWRT